MVRVVCLGALTAAAALALVGGRILARRSLDPLHRILATAREIDAQRLSARLPRSNNGDELDQLAATLNDLLGRVERYVRHMEQFTADAAHELRTPLAALRGLTEVALRRPRSADELRQTIEEFGEHAERLARLAEDLLFLARIDAGEPVFRHEPVRLDQAAADAVELMEPLAAERGLELVIHAHAEAVVNGDGGRLRQLVGNLIDNAVKFSGAPGRVSVSVEQVNGDARVLVADTGSGIPADHLPRIFDRFYRIDQARSAQQDGGAGLGLSICKSIVEAHGGKIELRSAPGNGTVAEVRLPLSQAWAVGA
jgi:heavy metal sensor kinase